MMCVYVNKMIDGPHGPEDTTIGEILYDGQRVFANPPNDPVLEGIVHTNVYDPWRDVRVDASDPEHFMSLLHVKFDSVYLRASVPTSRA